MTGAPRAFLLTWNPRRFPIEEREYARRVAQVERGEPLTGRWSTGQNRSRICAGDAVYWLRQGPDRRGLLGSGVAASEIYQAEHYEVPGRTANYVEHAFDVLLPVEDRLETEVLLHVVPKVPWNYLQGSGYQVPEHSRQLLADTWLDHLRALGRTGGTTGR